MEDERSQEGRRRESPFHRISVARGLKFLYGMTIVIIIGATLLGVALSWRHFIDARRIVDYVALDRTLFVAATETRGEIGVVGIALLSKADAETPVDDALHRVDNIYRLVKARIENVAFGGKRDDLARLRRAHERQMTAATDVRAQAALPLGQRDVGEISLWRQAIYGMAQGYVDASADVGTDLTALNPALAELVTIREISFAIRDRYSRQCSGFRRSVERDIPLTPVERDLWQRDIGAYQELWKRVSVIASHLPQYPQLMDAIRTGRRETAQAQRAMNATLNNLSGRGGRQDEPENWAQHCFGVYDSILGIGHIALDLARRDAESEQRRALINGSLWTLAFILAIAFSFVSSRFLRQRFSTPMARIARAIKRLESGDYQTPVPGSRSKDEPGAISATLEGLRIKVAKAEHLRRHLDHLRDELVDHARESNRAKSLFLATISHEIRTPLNGILGSVQLLKDSSLTREQRRWVEGLEKSGTLLHDLVSDVLDYSRIEAGRFSLAEVPFSLSAQVSVVEAAIASSAQQKGLDYTSTIAADVPDRVVGDPAKVGQILLNLLGNAVKFTESGHICLAINVDPTSGREQMPCIRFRIADTGIGIPPERRDVLFTPFTQADGTIARRFGGSGLGLAICKGLLQMMGGQIDFECPPEGGTVFIVRLPLLRAGAEDTARPADTALTRALPTLSVLIAEDNPVNAMIARELVSRAGHTVRLVGDGKSALEAAANEDFDVILMDLAMPGSDGIETTRRIRALEHETRRMVPVIALTADLTAEQRLGQESDLFDGFVGKPYRREDLESEMARAIGLLPPMRIATAAREQSSILQQHARDLGVDWARKIVELYMTETPHVAEGLKLMLGKDDLGGIADIAHRIKGGADHVGALTIARYAREAERAAEAGDRDEARRAAADLLAVLDDELEKLAAQAEAELQDAAAPRPFAQE